MRSETMLEALEGAIQRYQAIVSAGGWPQIPGTRMIRPEDDDERLPLLRRRLMISGELRRQQASGFFESDEDVTAAVRRFQGRSTGPFKSVTPCAFSCLQTESTSATLMVSSAPGAALGSPIALGVTSTGACDRSSRLIISPPNFITAQLPSS